MNEVLVYAPALAVAILSAQRAVKTALKESRNTFHGYKYASAEEVIIVGREALHGAGLVMVPVSEDFEPLQEIDDRCGGAVATVRCRYAVVHESGASICFSTDVPVVPERGKSSGWSRPADKATFGARTEALGYALRDFLLIPRADAPDVSGRSDGPRTGPGPREESRPQPAPAAPLSLDACLQRIREAKSGNDMARAVNIARRDRPAEEHVQIERAFAARIAEALQGLSDAEKIEKLGGLATRADLRDPESLSIVTKALSEARSHTVPQ